MPLNETRLHAMTLAATVLIAWSATGVAAQPSAPPPPVNSKAATPKPLQSGDVLSGQLNAIRTRGKKGKKAPTFQLVSEPRRLSPPGGLCNLETGPETFQIVTSSDVQAAQLKPLIGKQVALRIEQVGCAEEAGIMSEAVVTKWSIVGR